MKVELKPHTGRMIGSPEKIVHFDQYRVYVDGVGVGFLSFNPGSRVCLTDRFSPLDVEEIERQVLAITRQDLAATSQAPDVPAELLENETEDEDDDEYDLD